MFLFSKPMFLKITNETTTIELLICFIYTQKSNYLHNNIFLVIEITKEITKKGTTQKIIRKKSIENCKQIKKSGNKN